MNVETIVQVPRDRWTRPLIIPPHGGKPIPYTRCTTYVGALEDTYNLGQWQMRMVASGVAAAGLAPQIGKLGLEPDTEDEKKAWKTSMEPLVEQAMEAAKADRKAKRGTQFHEITERLDTTGDVTDVPPEWSASLDAFAEATRGLEVMAVEQFLVNDEHQVGGTADRIYRVPGVDGYVIGDLKTGSITWGIGKIAMQLAMYANSKMYNPVTGERTAIPGLRTDFGIVMDHDIPNDTCRLVRVDLEPAWDAVQLAKRVRAWRTFAKPANLSKPFRIDQTVDAAAAALDNAIAQAVSREQIAQLWAEANPKNLWLPRHMDAANQRIAHLDQNATPAA